MSQNGPQTTSHMMSLTKNQQPQPKILFRVQTKRLAESFEGLNFEQLLSAIGGGAMALVKQSKTAGFRPIFRYKHIVHQLSRC